MSGTVQIKNRYGNIVTVRVGSNAHKTYANSVVNKPMSQQQQTSHNMSNNANRAQQNAQTWGSSNQSNNQQSYNNNYTPPTTHYSNSDNVKSLDSSGQSNFSVSGYQGATNPSFNVSSNVTNLLNQLREQEALANKTWNTPGQKGYNDIWSQRNQLSGQLLNSIMQDSGGKASLSEIESIFGRRIENQELASYRNIYNDGNEHRQSQLNNLWEHDFATRNNGEHYQYVQNYMNGDKNAPLAESMKRYLDSLSGDALSSYNTSMADSLKSTQDYFNKRSTGWTPEYVNNTVNPNPWGEIDASDIINNGGARNQMLYDDWMASQMNPMMNQSPMQQQYDPLAEMLAKFQEQQAQQEALLQQQLTEAKQQNAYRESQINKQTGGQNIQTGNKEHIYSPGNTSNTNGYTSNQLVESNALNRYLESILNGGF